MAASLARPDPDRVATQLTGMPADGIDVAVEHLSQVMGRIAEIRSRMGLPAPGTGFAQILEAKLSSTPSSAGTTLSPFASVPAVAALGPAPRGVVTAAELASYLSAHGMPGRNGRLDASELVEVTGGWSGRPMLLPPAADAWEQMRNAAAADGIDLRVIDAYRSWESQDRAYQAHLAGEKRANVLPPGRSQHGAGLAVDVTNGHIVGPGDPEWRWLDDNAWRFGWYPISNESWHWEFRGLGA